MASVRDDFFVVLYGLKLFRLRSLRIDDEDIPYLAVSMNEVFSRSSRSFRINCRTTVLI